MTKKKSLGNPSGFRDLTPAQAKLKSWMVATISKVYEKYGFVSIETPLVEFTYTLVSEVTDFNLFTVSPSKERQKGEAQSLSLRFDQTVPLARYVVDHAGTLAFPFKRYVIGPSFRGETPQFGRYRQFDQFDADIVGSSNIASDIEILLCMREVMCEIIGENNFVIRVSSRKIINCLPEIFEFDLNFLRQVSIELDKKDKVSPEDFFSSLLKIGLSISSAQGLVDFGTIAGSPREVVEKLRKYESKSKRLVEVLDELELVADALELNNIEEIIFDMSIIRGLGYYTGMVFETLLKACPGIGSVYSGGRYDDLVASFGIPQLPSVGTSVGVDRLLAALESIDFQIPNSRPRFIVLLQNSSVLAYAFSVASEARATGVVCEVYTGNKTKLSDQFEFADKSGYEYTIIVGSNEEESKTVTIKNQATRSQEVVKLEDIKSFIKQI